MIVMKVYRGDFSDKFEVKHYVRSRYGIPALFFTPDKDLARLYGQWYNRQRAVLHKECIYMCEIPDQYLFDTDFRGQPSYSPEFRNLIYTLKSFKIRSGLIRNVVDFPDQSTAYYQSSDIIVVFDFSLISGLTLLNPIP
jgi:hypothetical protein